MSFASVLKLALGVVIVSSLVGLLAGVDFDEVIEELKSADLRLLVLGLLVAPLAQVFFSFSTLGASIRRLPFLPVLMLQYAIQFIALVLPATAARVALQIRFFERLGVSYGAATSMGALDSVGGFVVQVLLLLLIGASSLPGATTTVSTGSDTGGDESSDLSLVAMAVLIGLIWTVVTLAVPRRRARIRRAVPRFIAQMRDQASEARSSLDVLRHPGKVVEILGGNLGGQVIQAIVLGICLAAFGESASLSQLILVNTCVSLFAGMMPVPGGVGVAEAGYTYGLQAIGVPTTIAVSTATRVPPRHVLPAPAVVLPGHEVAAQERLRLTRAPCRAAVGGSVSVDGYARRTRLGPSNGAGQLGMEAVLVGPVSSPVSA